MKGRRNFALILDEPDTKFDIDDNPEQVPHEWASFLRQNCPIMYNLIKRDIGFDIDPEKLNSLMIELNIKKCKKSNCLKTKCSILWKYYVKLKAEMSKGKKIKCGNTVVDMKKNNNYSCFEVDAISKTLFEKDGVMAYDTSELDFLYNMSALDHKGAFGQIFSVRRRTDGVILKKVNNPHETFVPSLQSVRYLQTAHDLLGLYFAIIFDIRVANNSGKDVYVIMEALDGDILKYREYFISKDPSFNRRTAHILASSFLGLKLLWDAGYQHNDVKTNNLGFKIDLKNGTILPKWIDFDTITPREEKFSFTTERIRDSYRPKNEDGTLGNIVRAHHDLFSFGILVYEMTFGKHPLDDEKQMGSWALAYNNPNSDIHKNIENLRNSSFGHVGFVAYNFIQNPDVTGLERWSYEQADEYLVENLENYGKIALAPEILTAIQR